MSSLCDIQLEIREVVTALEYINTTLEELNTTLREDNKSIYHYFNLMLMDKDRKQSPEIRMATIKNCGLAILLLNNPTEEECIVAVEQDSNVLQYIRNQTEKICIAAINKDVFALQHVKNQTLKICHIAVKKNFDILDYIKNIKIRQQVYNLYKGKGKGNVIKMI